MFDTAAPRSSALLGVAERMKIFLRRRDLATFGAWFIVSANAGIIVILWWRGGNVQATNSTEWLNSLGRLTGLLSAYLALVQVLLLARLPLLERAVGFDKLTIWHRLNGKIVILLVVAHVILTTIGYALIDQFTISQEVRALLSSYPGMVAATIGTALFLIVAGSSIFIARRRLPYETWHVIHVSVYAAIALAWVHQIPTGNEFITNPAAADYWTSLYIITFAALVLFRVVQPVALAFRYRLRVEQVVRENPTVVSVYMTGRHLEKLRAQAGQFFFWRFLSRDRFWESHPFSLSASPDGQSLRITVKSSGDFTARIGEIKPGTPVLTEGPFGVFTEAVQELDRVLFIAGGIGITPIRALLEEMTGDLVLLYRVLGEQDIVFREELDLLSRVRGIRIHYVVGDHANPANKRLLSPEHIRTTVPDVADREVYLCGPPAMMNVLERNVRLTGVPAQFIHAERFAI